MEIRDKRYTEAQLKAMPEEQYNSTKFTFYVVYRHKRTGNVPERDLHD